MAVNRMVAYIFGAIYLLVGLAGFFVTGFDAFAATDGELLVVFEVNPLHNIVHLAIGGLLVGAAASGFAAARSMNILVGAVYLVVGIIGFAALDQDWNILALNMADNWLHIGSAVILLAVAFLADKGLGTARA